MIFLLFPALACVALGVFVGWWVCRLDQGYRTWDDELAARQRARAALAEWCSSVDVPPFEVITEPYDWQESGA